MHLKIPKISFSIKCSKCARHEINIKKKKIFQFTEYIIILVVLINYDILCIEDVN